MAGGIGERLRPITYTIPKPLVPIASRPCIEYMVKALAAAGVTELIITGRYLFEELIRRIGDGRRYGLTIVYAIEETPLGTAGSVKNVSAFLDDAFFVGSADVLADVDLVELYEFHRAQDAKVTIALTTVADPRQFGIMELSGEGRITRYKEKPKTDEIFSNLINAGIYVIEPEILQHIPERAKFDFSKNLFPLLLEKAVPIHGKKLKGVWKDIGNPQDLIEANRIFAEGENHLCESVKLGTNARLNDAYLAENVTIGDDASIEHSLIMHDVSVGKRTRIKNTVICPNCTIAEDIELVDSVIGARLDITESMYDEKVEGE